MWKKILLLFVALILVCILGVTIYFNSIDWNRHKDMISQQFSSITGKEVVFDGPVRFNIFPSPYLEAVDIKVYNRRANGEKILLSKIKKLVSRLSIQSLVKGRFNVERMNLSEPEIFVELYSDGKLNWLSANGSHKDFKIDNVDMSLNSITIENAKMHLISEEYDVHSVLESFNAEVIAQSLYGPYRIDGSFIQNKSPNGISVSLGQFSDGFATPVNAVISHQESSSYLRFDGTVLLENDAVNGNLIFDSQNPVNFMNTNFQNTKISEDYEEPLGISMELKTDKNKIALSNIVLKYGQSAGAGNILIPRKKQEIGEEKSERRRIDIAFNMTDLHLQPVVHAIEGFIKKYDKKENFYPEYDFDVIADLKALKASYNNQFIRDFDLSFDFVDNVLKIQNLSAVLPGETSVKLNGEVYSFEKKLTYGFNLSSTTSSFDKFLKLFDIDLPKVSSVTYKKGSLNALVEGNTELMKIAPFDFMLDKSEVHGKLGVSRNKNTRWFLIANADHINFDNYIGELPQKVAEQNWRERLAYRFSKFSFLKDLDIQFRGFLDTGIMGKTPFENFMVEGEVRDGVMNIAHLKVEDVASANAEVTGEVSGFGQQLQFNNLKYDIRIDKADDFAHKFGIEFFGANFNKLHRFSGKGVITGTPDRFAVKSVAKLGHIENSYRGEVAFKNDKLYLNGKTDIKTSNFVKMLNDFSIDYNPMFPLGLFKMSSEVKTNGKVVLLNNLNANIGLNHFSGDVAYQEKNKRHQVKANLELNQLEIEKFFYNSNNKDAKANFRKINETKTFLVKPKAETTKINYGWLKNWDMSLDFKAKHLSYKDKDFIQNSGKITLNNGVAELRNYRGEYADGFYSGQIKLDINNTPTLSGKINISDAKINKKYWSGDIYGLTKGILSSGITFNTSVLSQATLLSELSGVVTFEIRNPVVKGWNFGAIEQDLAKRDIADGFATFARDALCQGETNFDLIKGDIQLEKGEFVVGNTNFISDAETINLTADGSLKNWTQNSSFSVSFHNCKVPGMDFSYKGDIETPILDVDVRRVTDVYDAYWEKVKAEAKAKEKARLTKYGNLMKAQQSKAQDSEDILKEKIVKDFDIYSKMAKDTSIVQEYRSLEKDISAVQKKLKAIYDKEKVNDIDDEIIAQLKLLNEEISAELSRLIEEFNRVHLKDVKNRLNTDYDAIAENNIIAQGLSSDYSQRLSDLETRLTKIQTAFYPNKDVSVNNWKKEIESALRVIDSVRSDAASVNIKIQSISDVEQLEKYYRTFEIYKQNTNDELVKMKRNAEELIAYVSEKVEFEEKQYHQNVYEQEVRKKVQENIGQISTVGGKVRMVERDFQEIQRSENAVKNNQLQVLDFSHENNAETDE